MVCFCDIPVRDLFVHMQKYSKFGLSFPKGFLAEKGANPVSYVVKTQINPLDMPKYEVLCMDVEDKPCFHSNAHMLRTSEKKPRVEVLDMMMKKFNGFIAKLENSEEQPSGEIQVMLSQIHYFLNYQVFAFVKVFDCNLPDTDKNNYYMEREWRILHHVKFQLDDVYRVMLPRLYSKRFRKYLPDYGGQITFAD